MIMNSMKSGMGTPVPGSGPPASECRRYTRRMSATAANERAQRLVLVLGVAVLGLAVAVGVFIRFQARDLGPPEEVPRALAIPALYGTMGLLAIMGALRRRPAIVAAAGVLCLAGSILSFATIEFAVPGFVLMLFSSRLQALPARHGSEAVVAVAAVVLVVGAAVALLGMTGGSCWQATGSPADPTYTAILCAGGASASGSVGAGQTFGSGSDSGALTTRGGAVEALLLLSTLTLTAVTGRAPTAAPV